MLASVAVTIVVQMSRLARSRISRPSQYMLEKKKRRSVAVGLGSQRDSCVQIILYSILVL